MKRQALWTAAIALTLAIFGMGNVLAAPAPAKPPLPGSKDYAPTGRGFGSAHPKQIHNGGVASGWVHNIRWQRWGKKVAFGVGLGHQYKPSGGYYRKHVKVRLHARRLGYCGNSNWPAYTKLKVRIEKKPGGPFTRWFSWSGTSTICEW